MTMPEIISELQVIDNYFDNIDPRDELGVVVVRGRKRLEVDFLRELRKAKQLQEAQERERTFKDYRAELKKVDPTFRVRGRLETLCREEHCEDLLACGSGIFPHLVHVWAELQRHPNQTDAILARFGLDHIDRDFFLDLMRRADEP